MSSPANPPLDPFVSATSDPARVYFLQGGARRLVPDQPPLDYILAGQAVRVLSDADLVAIPQAADLPSRKDGLLVAQKFLVPTLSVAVYFLAGGQRRRIPDIETLVGMQRRPDRQCERGGS